MNEAYGKLIFDIDPPEPVLQIVQVGSETKEERELNLERAPVFDGCRKSVKTLYKSTENWSSE